MGLFDKVKKFIEEVDSAANQKQRTQPVQETKEFEFGEKFFEQVIAVIEYRSDTEKQVLPREEHYYELDTVGESFHLEDITELVSKYKNYEEGWFSGFLLPEPDNKYDANAVAVYLVDGKSKPLTCVLVGHISKEQAKQIQPRLIKLLLNKGKIVPFLAKIKGGSGDKKNFGVYIRAYTEIAKVR